MRVTVDGKSVEARPGMTVLEAAEAAGIRIPTLCRLKGTKALSLCRICLVQVNGGEKLLPACSTAVSEGMEVVSSSEAVRRARRRNLELICSDHRMECTECSRAAACELRELCREYEIDDRAFGAGDRPALTDESTPWLLRDNTKCILCRRCAGACGEIQGVGVLFPNGRAAGTDMGFGVPLAETKCVGCGQCVAACPTGALREKDDTKAVWRAVYDRDKTVVMALSPLTYLHFGEMLGEAEGDCSGKLAGILRRMGIDYVIDGGTAAGTVRRETLLEAAERVKRGEKGLLSANCPAWRRYVEAFHPAAAERLLRPRSEAALLAAQTRQALPDRDVFFVSVSHCVAAKSETAGGGVDAALTTRELYELLRQACVSAFTLRSVWEKLPAEALDTLFAEEASFRPAEKPGLLEKTEEVDGLPLRIAEVTGLSGAGKLLPEGAGYDLLLAAACPGGCFRGGGAPRNVEWFPIDGEETDGEKEES